MTTKVRAEAKDL